MWNEKITPYDVLVKKIPLDNVLVNITSTPQRLVKKRAFKERCRKSLLYNVIEHKITSINAAKKNLP